MHYLGFLFCAALIFFAGKRLSFYGDIIAEKTGLGKAWFGLIMMSAVTSLPELAVGISSAAIVKSPDLAVGDVLGSCAFNLGILSMLDFFYPRQSVPLLGRASQSHILAGTMGIILLCMVGWGLILPNETVVLGWVGVISIICAAIYFVSVRLIFLHERTLKSVVENQNNEDAKAGKILSLKEAIVLYILFALVVVSAALFLPSFAETIAEETGLGKTFVGTLFLAFSTSLPEIAVSIASIRMGSVDMAVGNLMGSNIFNIFILSIDDVFYTSGPILKSASDMHSISVFAAIMMTAVAIAGLMYKASSKKFWMAWDTMLILVIYVVSLVLLYHYDQGK